MSRTPVDLTGQTFGELTAIKPAGRMVTGGYRWAFTCLCGNKYFEADGAAVRRGRIVDCGSIYHAPSQLPKPDTRATDLAGMVFGLTTALRPLGSRGSSMIWACRCACGRPFDSNAHALQQGMANSCGCGRRVRPPLDGVDRSRYAASNSQGK